MGNRPPLDVAELLAGWMRSPWWRPCKQQELLCHHQNHRWALLLSLQESQFQKSVPGSHPYLNNTTCRRDSCRGRSQIPVHYSLLLLLHTAPFPTCCHFPLLKMLKSWLIAVKMEKHLVLFQVVSAGQNGAELGNDEEQIVYVLYTILNVEDNKVRDLWGISNFFFGV